MFNAKEQAKYREFKDARRGAADYIAMEGEFSKYLEDVYSTPPVEREALSDDCEIVVIGARFRRADPVAQTQGGWASTMCASARRVETSAAPGNGTAIPALRATLKSYSYLPLLEEMGYYPTMKFASGFEILE